MQNDLAPGAQLPTTISELTAGLAVFCARPSPLQACSDAYGDEWRHAGLLVDTKDGLMIASFGRRHQYSLRPVESLANYTRVGVASVVDDDQLDQLQRWVEQFADVKAHYPVSSIPMAGLLSLARTKEDAWLRRGLVLGLAKKYCRWLSRRYSDKVAFICSTFVCSAVNAAREEPLQLAMSSYKFDDEARQIEQTPMADVLLARWLATPSDIWRTIPEERRCDLRLDTPATPIVQPKDDGAGNARLVSAVAA